MGSDSDFETMKKMIPVLNENGVEYEFRVMSAHRTPVIATEYAKNAKANGFDLIIAGAGMSAHLPGVLAAFTGVPIIGVPIKSDSSGMDGMDALHSIIQMPPGIPVATVGIDNVQGAANLAVKMIDCYCKADSENQAGPVVKIVYSRNEVSEENLKKATDALNTYRINSDTIDLTGAAPEEIIKSLGLNSESMFVILNLTGVDIEQAAERDENARKKPIVVVPKKASSDEFNATSNKIYHQTENAGATAFVGVNSFQNAAHLIARIAGIHSPAAYDGVVEAHAKLAAAVVEKDAKIREEAGRAARV